MVCCVQRSPNINVYLVAELYSHEFEGDWCKMQLGVVITDSQGNHITADLM